MVENAVKKVVCKKKFIEQLRLNGFLVRLTGRIMKYRVFNLPQGNLQRIYIKNIISVDALFSMYLVQTGVNPIITYTNINRN